MDQSTELAALRQEVAELKAAVKDLVDAWNTARGMVRFVKWMGGIATAVTAIAAALKFLWSK